MPSRRKVVTGRRALDALLVAMIVGAGVAAAVITSSSASPTTVTTTGTVTRGTVQATETATGNVSAAATYSLNFATGGTVTAIDVTVGQQVTQGQTLASRRRHLRPGRPDRGRGQPHLGGGPADTGRAPDQLVLGGRFVDKRRRTRRSGGQDGATSLGSTRGAISGDAGRRLDRRHVGRGRRDGVHRVGGTGGSGTTTTTAPSAATTTTTTVAPTTTTTTTTTIAPNPATVASDEEAVTSAQAAVTAAQQTLNGTTLTAPASGTITAIKGTVGGTVSAGSNSVTSPSKKSFDRLDIVRERSSAASTGFMTLADLSQLEITCDIAEADVGDIHQGDAATVTLNALTGQKFAATVAAVSPTGTTSDDVVTYPVTLTLQDPTSAVKPGMSASCEHRDLAARRRAGRAVERGDRGRQHRYGHGAVGRATTRRCGW